MRSCRLESMRKYVRICYSSCNRGTEETVGCLMRTSCRYTRIWCDFCDLGSRRSDGMLRGGCATLCGYLKIFASIVQREIDKFCLKRAKRYSA